MLFLAKHVDRSLVLVPLIKYSPSGETEFIPFLNIFNATTLRKDETSQSKLTGVRELQCFVLENLLWYFMNHLDKLN